MGEKITGHVYIRKFEPVIKQNQMIIRRVVFTHFEIFVDIIYIVNWRFNIKLTIFSFHANGFMKALT